MNLTLTLCQTKVKLSAYLIIPMKIYSSLVVFELYENQRWLGLLMIFSNSGFWCRYFRLVFQSSVNPMAFWRSLGAG